MKLELETRDKELLGEIFNEPEIAKANSIALGEGVALKGLEWRFFKADNVSDVAIVLITVAPTVPATVAANLITEWIRGRLKGHVTRVTIEEKLKYHLMSRKSEKSWPKKSRKIVFRRRIS